MVEKSGQNTPARTGRPGKARWAKVRGEYEAGAALCDLALRHNLRADTITARAEAEDWSTDPAIAERLRAAFVASLSAAEAVLAADPQPEPAAALKLLEAAAKAWDRLRALRAAEEADRDDREAPSADNATEADLRQALQRRLACLADTVAENADPGGVEPSPGAPSDPG